MKKHLIAAAVAAAVTVPAMAQSNVTLYGRLDAGYNSLEVTPSTYTINLAGFGSTTASNKSAGIAFGTDQTSLWGMRGTEDLGGGMKANFVVESGFNAAANTAWSGLPRADGGLTGQSASPSASSSAAVIGNRQLYAGLSFASGTEIRVGHQSSLVRDVAVGYAADSATNVTGNIIAFGWVPRHNAVTIFQTVGDLKLGASVSQQYTNSMGAGALDTNIGSGYSLQAIYTGGPLSAGISYMKTKNGVDDQGSGASANNDRTALVAGASYDLKLVKLFGQYGTLKNDNVIGLITTPATTGVGTGNTTAVGQNAEASGWNVGVSVPVGAVGMFASYSGGKNTQRTAGYEGDINGYNVGARYAFSKRTNAYAIYGNTKVDYSAAGTVEAKQFGVGVTHSF